MIRAAAITLVLAALATLAACSRGADNAKAPSPTPNAAPPASRTAVASASTASCAPAPTLAPGRDFADPHDLFGKGSKVLAQLQANFSAAYDKACQGGLFVKRPLIPANVPHPGTLFLHNAPDANDVAIYPEPNDSDRRSDLVLEYYFITADGRAHVPSTADLQEAIYCDTVGATQQEQERSGRCLVD